MSEMTEQQKQSGALLAVAGQMRIRNALQMQALDDYPDDHDELIRELRKLESEYVNFEPYHRFAANE